MNKNKTQKPAAPQQKKKKTKKAKKRRNFFLPILFGITVAFTIGCVMLCQMILENSNNFLFSTKADVLLDDFNGMTVEEVQAASQYKQLDVIFEEEYNSSIPAGVVYRQSPVSGRTVKEDQQVTLTVSLGTKYVTLADYSNLTQSDAQNALLDAGVYVVVLKNVESSVAVGSVIRTEPAAGETVEAGSTVYLYVSMAAVQTTTTMPDLLGVTVADALTLLTQNKITMGSQVYEYNDLYPADTIIAQGVAAGETVSVNSRVAVTISMGPEPLSDWDIYLQWLEENGGNNSGGNSGSSSSKDDDDDSSSGDVETTDPDPETTDPDPDPDTGTTDPEPDTGTTDPEPDTGGDGDDDDSDDSEGE